MFKHTSNVTFNNDLFSSLKIDDMHETTKRLYEAASLLQNTKGQSAVARLMNRSPQILKNWESRGVSKQGMVDAEKIIGCRSSWIESGEGDMEDGANAPFYAASTFPEERQSILIDTQNESIGAQSRPLLISLSEHPDLLAVPRVKFKLSAGVSGFAIEPENGNGKPIFFRKDWFEMNNYRPEALFGVRVSGASMEPALWDGDLVVINTADINPHDGEAFALNYEGELVIKRMRRDAGEWWATSDNSDQRRFAPKRCTEGVVIIGRVIYKQSERI